MEEGPGNDNDNGNDNSIVAVPPRIGTAITAAAAGGSRGRAAGGECARRGAGGALQASSAAACRRSTDNARAPDMAPMLSRHISFAGNLHIIGWRARVSPEGGAACAGGATSHCSRITWAPGAFRRPVKRTACMLHGVALGSALPIATRFPACVACPTPRQPGVWPK